MAIALFDAHCDTLRRAWREGRRMTDPALHAAVHKAVPYGPYTQLYAVFTDKEGYPAYRSMVALAERELAPGYILSIEGAEGIDCDINKLPAAYADGVRSINITWNYDNILAGAAAGEGYGLTETGAAFLEKMEELGIFADMSHISDKAFWDIIERAKKPIIASHSNSRKLCPVPRNLTDEQFLAIVKNGGCVGLNYYTGFLGLGENIDAILAHAEHFLALGGEKHLGLGSDFDGCELPADIRGLEDVGKIYETMLRRNWNEDLVRDIFYNNFRRLFDEHTDIRPEKVL